VYLKKTCKLLNSLVWQTYVRSVYMFLMIQNEMLDPKAAIMSGETTKDN
jgi:hypothetical protein